MGNAYFLAIDIGTTNTKCLAFAQENNEILAQYSVAYPTLYPQLNHAEQDPDLIFEAVVTSINKVQNQLQNDLCDIPNTLLALTFSAAMHSLILLDEDGKPLTNCIIWADNRAAKIADDLRKSTFGKKIFQRTGTPQHAMTPFYKLLWLQQNEAQLYQKAEKFVGIKEYVFYRLLGKYVADTSLGSATGLMNLEKKEWDKGCLKKLNLSQKKFSTLYAPCSIFYFEKKKFPNLNIIQNTPFVIGASDGCLANLGSGALKAGEISVTIGTSGAIRAQVAKPYLDKEMRIFCYFLKENNYIIGGGTNSGTLVLEWLKNQILKNKDTYETFYKQAEKIEAGAEGLLFLPYILGERAPLWNAEAKGVFFGLSHRHEQAHLVRAAMESVIYHLFLIGKILKEQAPIHKIYASGGFAQSTFWLQLLADIFQCEVALLPTHEVSAFGAVQLAREALCLSKIDFETQKFIFFKPNKDLKNTYHAHFERFVSLYEQVKDFF